MYLKDIEKSVKEVITASLASSDGAAQDTLNLDASFLELGINSVLAVEIVEAINQKLLIELGVEVMFDYRDIKELTRFIFQHYGTEDLSKELPPLADNVQFSGEGTISRDLNKTPVPAIEAESDESQEALTARRSLDIAIIGISGRFARSANLEAFWQHLQAGESCIEEIKRKGWETNAYYDPDPERMNTSISKWGGMLQDVDKFDPLFFNISPLEAARMDPQQRLFLQEAYKSFEDAGYSAEQLSDKKVGVFVGARSGDYKEQALRRDSAMCLFAQAGEIDAPLFLGNDMAILAARISYFLNCKGPSLTIDTACSSSLVAIHLACESIRTGEAEMALAGGVFVLSSPEFYVMTSKTQMLSPDGKCKTFDNTANGIVIGEGVGAVILKPLETALADGDHIYGVIRGSGMNQDGRTKGITAPSMLSQKALLSDVYKKAAIHPETVSYIEAHGTGTKLGDPIEIKALTEAFREFTDKTQFCAIGSHKPNFGHTIMTAGIAGVFKVLLAMKYQQLPSTINIEEVNQYIDLERSPFFINTELREWKSRDRRDRACPCPRRAGISSFGFSGTNCHIILEEPPLNKKTILNPTRPAYFFPLSAKTKAALAQKVADLVKWLEKEGETYGLADISYTLVQGRTHFSVRTAVIARDTNELLHALREIMSKAGLEHDVENAKGHRSEQTEPHLQQYGHWLLTELLENTSLAEKEYKEKLAALADLYVKGYSLDWGKFFNKGRYHRVPLPTYPFSGESYWPAETSRGQSSVLTAPYLHPLVQRNTSTLWEQRFSSTFRGDEFFLTDHVIFGQCILPGVAHLEMARAAVAVACDRESVEQAYRLRDIVWLRPLICDPAHPVTVHIVLEAQENGTIVFLVCREVEQAQASRDSERPVPWSQPVAAEEEMEAYIYSRGIVEWHSRNDITLDLSAVRARCQHQISGTELYQHFRSLGLSHGPAFRGIEELSVGEDEGLARLRLPAVPGLAPGVTQTHPEGDKPLPYVLPPDVLDATVQACIRLFSPPAGTTEKLQVPFALEELSIVGEVKAAGWAWIRRRQSSAMGQVFDADLCDDTGRLAVQVRGLSIRPFLTGEAQTMLLTPNWKEEGITSLRPSDELLIPTEMLVLLCDLPSLEASRIQAQMATGGRCRVLKVNNWPSSQSPREQRFQEAALQLIQELQHLWQSKPVGVGKELAPFLVQVVVAHREEPTMLEALVGALKTAEQEYPQLQAQLIEVEGELEEEELFALLHENQSHTPQESHIRYRDGKRWVKEWQELDADGGKPRPYGMPWKEGGCYLISGGAGGLGRLFVQEIARQIQKATVILVGRSTQPRELRTYLEQVGRAGLSIDYQQVDVSHRSAVHALIQRVLQQHGHLDGIIHATGVLRDSLLLNKTQEDVEAVLAPKIFGVKHLDEESCKLSLDFFILCSSLTAVTGNMGQADYATANAYLDAFAHARQAQVIAGERQGATVSINWPLWEEGGMQIEAEAKQMMRRQLGVEAMGTETGIKTLYQALGSGFAQVAVAHGQVERIKQRLLPRSPEASVGIRPAHATPATSLERATHPDREVWQDGLLAALKSMVSHVFKVRVEEIDTKKELSEYGFDSINSTRFANHLNQTYQLDVTAPIFFQHSTIDLLAQYLQAQYTDILAPRFTETTFTAPELVPVDLGLAPRVRQDSALASAATEDVSLAVPIVRQRSRMARLPKQMPAQQMHTAASGIAIIGMSGAFPQSPDVQSFWSNLLAGKDCIGEIPRERWDWETYFGDPATEVNKTNVKWAGILEGIELFDPLFFGISKAEAERMDPQQRLLMMYVWKAIEDAGYAASDLSGTNTALFVGTTNSGYNERFSGARMTIEGYSATSQVPSVGPNRMSYLLNLHGPSEPIETACSSSLIAVHQGVNAIESGQCTVAIVGGINVLVSPELHISFSKAGMLCEDGRCKTFSAQANGYVRGEGVGMLVLKRLSDAERDGDHIYGVIRGSAENHGGRASSLTAPNPRAQAELLIAAYLKAGIDPRTVGYIEAHGTGTPLGDPIEINGLKTAFSELRTGARHSPYDEELRTGARHNPYDEEEGPTPQAWCGIGSVKSNIGHLELAAGVAGVIKVLLQMQHKKLVKSLHCEQINPYIQLDSSPFYIVQENREWEAPHDRVGNVLPRRAGVSSFSFGGANAHVVLEEYVPKPQEKTSRSLAQQTPMEPTLGQAQVLERVQVPPSLVVLSAKDKERLYEQVQQLLDWIQAGTHSEDVLPDLAYTLQVGRETMEERLALKVSSLAELEQRLHRYLQEPQETGDWYRGQVRQHKEMVTLFSTDEELQETVDKWLQRGKYDKLLEWWVKGLAVDWTRLYTVGAGIVSTRPHQISLPTYPFARERYWVPIEAGLTIATSSVAPVSHEVVGEGLAPFLHPLVQRNISDFFEQRFSSTFHGQEFFLVDHVINGQRMMPGVAYLEMARAAIAQATRSTRQEEGHMLAVGQVHRLRHIAWVHPLVVSSQPVTAHITLTPQENGTISFVVSGDATQEEEDTELVYCQGTAELHAENTVRSMSQSLDLTAILARCQPQWGKPTTYAAECYQQYRSLGFNYGPSFKGIEQLSRGEDEVLARFRLPEVVAQTRKEGGKPLPYVLHPSVLDATVHAGIVLQTEQELLVPFALDEIEILGEVPTQGWTWIRRNPGSATGKVQVVDVDVCNDAGHIALRLRGLSRRMLLDDPVQTTVQDAGASTSGLALGTEAQSISLTNTVEENKPVLYIPLWDWVSLSQPVEDPAQMSEEPRTPVAQGTQATTISGDTAKRVVIVGGTPDEQSAIMQVYPSARILEIPTGASIERLAQLLQELGAIGTQTGGIEGTRTGASPVPTVPHVFWLAPGNPESELSQESILAAQQQGVLACFRLIKALLQLGYASQPLQWTVITHGTRVLHATETGDPTHASLLGLFGSLAKEYAQWSIQLVDLPADAPLPLSEMHRLPADPRGHGWLYRNGHWYRQILVPLDISSEHPPEAYRRGGVYVIIGGAGGIGEVWSEYLIRRYQAQIIWIGRRKTDAGILAKLERLAALGPRPHYITADATDRFALQEAYEEIKRNFGQIHGVVHSAMVLQDQSLAKMDEERFQAALAAKVDVSVRLTQVFEHESLDFVLFFSSLNAFVSNAGQSNYAAGCTFEDAFAARLGRDWKCPVKVMNWGYWGSVGVVASQEYRNYMAQAGLGSIEPAEAMGALEHLLASPVDQMMLLKTVTAPVPAQTPGKPHRSTVAPWEEMIQTEETMTVYPEILPSYIHSLHNYHPPILKPPPASVTASTPVALKADISRLADTILPKEGKK